MMTTMTTTMMDLFQSLNYNNNNEKYLITLIMIFICVNKFNDF